MEKKIFSSSFHEIVGSPEAGTKQHDPSYRLSGVETCQSAKVAWEEAFHASVGVKLILKRNKMTRYKHSRHGNRTSELLRLFAIRSRKSPLKECRFLAFEV